MEKITYEDALLHADSPNDLRLMIKLASEDEDALLGSTEGLSLQEDDNAGLKQFLVKNLFDKPIDH